MALSIVESWSSDASGTMDDDGYITGTAKRVFTITSDSFKVDEGAALALMPALGSVHPRLGVAYSCRNRSLKRKSVNMFEGTATYRTPKLEDDDSNGLPWSEPAQVEFSTINETGETELDANGNAIATVNGEAFSVTKDYADLGIVVKKALQTFSPASFYVYINTVNSDVFLGFPAGTLRVTGISASPAKHDGTPYYNVSVNISARRPINTTNDKAWYWRGIERGYIFRDGTASGVSSNSVPTEKTPKPSSPYFLNANGTIKQKDDAASFREIKVYGSTSFSSMGIL